MDIFNRSFSAPPLQRTSLAHLLTHAFAILSGLLLVSFVGAVTTFVIVLGVINPQISRGARASAAIGLVQQGMLDEETGLRGYLLSGDRTFLDPYSRGQIELSDGNAATLTAIGDDPDLMARYDAGKAAQDAWIQQWAIPAFTNPRVEGPGGTDSPAFLDQVKVLFDRYRNAESAFNTAIAALISGAQDTQRSVLLAGGLAEICIFVAIVVAGMREYNRIQDAVVEPVDHLLADIAAIRDGSLDVRVRREGPSELRDISAGLAAMAESLSREQAMVAARGRELSAQTEQLRKAHLETERASEAKSEFLSRMSHELRTPLTAVIGFGELLDLESLTASQREFVDAITKAGNHLLELINDVLDITKIEAGRLQVNFEAINLTGLVRDVFNLARPLTSAHNISLLCGDLGDAPVIGDHQHLKQLLLNLVANAVKYNSAGGTVTVSAASAGDRTIRLAVTDTGPGISEENIAKLFSPFERLNASGSGIEGTGLGLALCQSLAEAMGASVGVESRVGTGSTFWVDLRTTPTGDDVLSTRPSPGTGGDRPNQRRYARTQHVLYVEDTLSNVRLVENIITRRPDIELLTAMQGSVALDIARDHLPDLIVLDLHLPDMDGDVVLQHLKADQGTRGIPVIMLSADATVREIERLIALGATSYLTKPIAMRALLGKLDSILAGEDDVVVNP